MTLVKINSCDGFIVSLNGYIDIHILFTELSWRQHKQVPFPNHALLICWKSNLLQVHDGNVSRNFYFSRWLFCKPLVVLKLLLQVAHKVVSSLVESLFIWFSLSFGCLFVDCSLFCWSSVLSSELICENSLFIIFSIDTKEHITGQCSWQLK